MFSPNKTIISIDLKGMIASGSRAPLNMDNLNGLFSKVMKMKFDALSIVINSPGGSPVQSSLIAQKIREISDKKKVKCYCFVEDVAASGGYWLACAADELYADVNSIVGSIGVISGGFGFTDLIKKIGNGLIIDCKPVNIFRDENMIVRNCKSVSFAMVFQDVSKTLKDENIEPVIKKIISSANKDFNAKLRI